MGSLVGDVYGRMGLDSSGFTSGVAAAQQSAARMGQTFDQVSGHADTAAGALDRHGKGVELSARSMDRFAAIGIEKFIPALEGSRVGIEGVLNGVYKLAGGYATLILAGVGVAGFLGSYLAGSFVSNASAAKMASGGIDSVRESLGKLELKLATTSGELRGFAAAQERLKASGRPQTPSGSAVLANLFNENERDRSGVAVDMMRRRVAIGDDFSEVGGLAAQANKAGHDLSVVFTNLDKEVVTFGRLSGELLVDDPLGKVLAADFEKAAQLIKKIREAQDSGVFKPAEASSRIQEVLDAANERQRMIRDQSALGGAPDLASRLGLGDNGIAKGFGDVKQLTRDAEAFKDAMIALVREGGIPARDIFPQIAEGQAKFNERIAALKEKYGDTPAIFNKLVEAERSIGNSEIIRGLNDTVNALGDIKKGTVTVIEESTGLETRYTPALSNAGQAGNYLAGVLYEDVPKAALAADKSMVTLTGNANLLADALARAYWNALALSQVSVANAGVATAPGNF